MTSASGLHPDRLRASAVIFDFDGVLANTERLHLAAFRDAFAPAGWTLTDDAYFTRYLGYDDVGTIEAFARDQRVSVGAAEVRALLAAKSAAYRRRLGGDDVLYAGAASCVARLGSAFALAIASGSLHAEIADILRGAGLESAFAAIVGADDVTRGKPAPDSYLAAAARLRVPPEACVAIEDSSWGLTAAGAAGLLTIAVTTTAPASQLAGANLVVSSLDAIDVETVLSLAARPRG